MSPFYIHTQVSLPGEIFSFWPEQIKIIYGCVFYKKLLLGIPENNGLGIIKKP